jgi:hypothetical protein
MVRASKKKSTQKPQSYIQFVHIEPHAYGTSFFLSQHTRIVMLIGIGVPSLSSIPMAINHCHCLHINNKLQARRAMRVDTVSDFQICSANKNVTPRLRSRVSALPSHSSINIHN